jgi:hypothetical protein
MSFIFVIAFYTIIALVKAEPFSFSVKNISSLISSGIGSFPFYVIHGWPFISIIGHLTSGFFLNIFSIKSVKCTSMSGGKTGSYVYIFLLSSWRFVELNGNFLQIIKYSVIPHAQMSDFFPLYISPRVASGLKY